MDKHSDVEGASRRFTPPCAPRRRPGARPRPVRGRRRLTHASREACVALWECWAGWVITRYWSG